MQFEDARNIVRRITAPLVRAGDRTLLGVAVGWRGDGPITRANRDEFCVVAYVIKLDDRTRGNAQKLLNQLASNADIRLREEVRLIETGGVFRPLAFEGSEHGSISTLNTKKWFASLRPGIGISNPTPDDPTGTIYNPAAGTAGFFLQDDNNVRDTYLVSCNHVIARSRKAGDRLDPEDPEVIVQPASLDLSGHDVDTIKTLHDLQGRFGVAELCGFVPLEQDDPNRTPQPQNFVDAAMARVCATKRRSELSRLPYGGRILGLAEVDPVTQTPIGSGLVYKVGRTTGYTEGTVPHVAGSFQVDYGGWTATFVDQVVMQRTPDNSSACFSDDGDSGSPVLTENHGLVGMILAASPNYSYACQARHVINELIANTQVKLSLVK